MRDFGLGDSWRLQHPTAKEFSFFSPVHHSYSRIDFFLTSNSMIPNISEHCIHSIIISDHAPVSFKWNHPRPHKPTPRWRFNTSLLKDDEFNNLIEKEWASFLEINDSSKPSPTLLWETGKAVLRGIIISYSAFKKKKERQQESELEEKIKQLEITNATNPTEENEKKLRQYKLQINQILNKKISFLINRLRQENFHYSNKSGKYLANQIKRNKEKSTIPTIKNSAGRPTNSPDEINQVFKEFYANLYSSDNNSKDEDITSFLTSVNFPHLSPEQKNTLDSPLTNEEIHSALNKMPNNKAPGPDGFPAEFYKHFWSILAPLFQNMLSEIQQNSRFPSNLNTASISLLLKPNKDPTLPSSYRPISLLNVDIKIITKALSHRLEKIIPSIIHPDQTGFIKGRHSANNTRRLFNIMHHSATHNHPTIITTLDAEKAFDRVNWSFLINTLNRFGFGESCINWVRTLYTSPTATVITNGQTSQKFTLHRGTRQGCPLSPSLFTIFIEPLAAAIRQNPLITGIQTPNMHHKISLYADDILLFIQNPQSSLSEVIKVINSFSSLSDYSINWNKSSILPLNTSSLDVAALTTPIPFCTSHITYLGIHISPRLSELITLNFTPLLKTINDDLQRWMNIPLSLLGRIATIKMTILPKINYLLSMIPTHPPLIWFNSVDSSINKFCWKNKPPRIKLTTLQKTKTLGGLNFTTIH
uniref:Reverse transcriptase domain-containing protein n=1 Tax=Salarias fasciatus TaxID=181472 RepID=A0A672F570_SALFA